VESTTTLLEVLVLKIIFKYTKLGRLKFISHLDTMRLLQRSLRRTGLNAKYSEGFNPHPKLSIAFPLSLGIESIGEFAEVELEDDIKPSDFNDKMNQCLLDGIKIVESKEYKGNKSTASLISSQEYNVKMEFSENKDMDIAFSKLNDLLKEEYIVERTRKKKNKINTKEINLIEYIDGLKADYVGDKSFSFNLTVKITETGSLKVEEIKEFVYNKFDNVSAVTIMRINLNFIDKNI
jgi:radical SAM-linked protein